MGLEFTAGSIAPGRLPGRHRFLMAKIGIGRPFVSQERLPALPYGYDSVLLKASDASRLFHEDGVASFQYEAGVPHTYIVQDSAQVLPAYIVEFEQETAQKKQQAADRVEDR